MMEQLKSYKILIPAKNNSIRCPNKNSILLPYTIKWIDNLGLLDKTIIITDSNEIKNISKQFNIETFDEINPNSGDINAVKDCAINLNLDCFYWFPLTHPFRSNNLLNDMFLKLKETNLVVSAQYIQDRSIYYLNNNKFIHDNIEHKGNMCSTNIMIDGAAYLIKTSWIETINNNKEFWNSDFKYVINKMPFLDIDTKEDLDKFNNIINLVNNL